MQGINYVLKWIVLILVVVLFSPALMRISGSISVAYIYVLFLPVVMFLYSVISWNSIRIIREIIIINFGFFFIVFVLLVLNVFSVSFVQFDISGSRPLLALLMFVIISFFLAWAFLEDNSVESRVIYYLGIGSLISCVVVVLSSMGFNLGERYYDGDDRYSAFFAHPNQLGIISACLFLLFYEKVLTAKKKAFGIVVLLSLLISLVLSGSKSSLILMVVVLGFSSIFNARDLKKVFSILFFIGFVGVIWAVFSEELISLNPRFFSVLMDNNMADFLEYRTVEDRLLLWSHAIDVASNSPYLGEGMGNQVFGYFTHSHNLIFDYLRTFGYPGAFLISFFIVYLLLIFLFKNYPGKECYRSAVLGYLFINMMSDSMGPQTVFLLAVCVGAYMAQSVKNRRGCI